MRDSVYSTIYLARDIPAFVMYCVYGLLIPTYRVYRYYDTIIINYYDWKQECKKTSGRRNY